MFELSLHSPVTEDEWDMIMDVDFDKTDRVVFHTKHGKEVEFRKVVFTKEEESEICGPEEFAKRMQKYADELNSPRRDMESVHRAADGLMLEVLEALGYGEGTAIFENMPKWYA